MNNLGRVRLAGMVNALDDPYGRRSWVEADRNHWAKARRSVLDYIDVDLAVAYILESGCVPGTVMVRRKDCGHHIAVGAEAAGNHIDHGPD